MAHRERILAEGIEHFRVINDQWGVAICEGVLGNVATDQGDYARAASLLASSLTSLLLLNDLWGVATVLPFHRAVLAHDDFLGDDTGFKVHTRWIETDFANDLEAAVRPTPLGTVTLHRTAVEIDGRRVINPGSVGQRFVRWCVEHPAYAQLLVWRPVPGFEPSAAAFKPAVEVVEFSTARFAELQDRGLLRADLDIDQVQRDWTVLVSGVVSQQLSNGPHDAFEDGRFTNALPELTRMFAAHYGVRKPTRRTHGNAR